MYEQMYILVLEGFESSCCCGFDCVCSDYSRSETAFAVISLALMLLGAGFSVYATRQPRYMFKRLCAALHFMTGALSRWLHVPTSQ